jgi:hypothetical protein
MDAVTITIPAVNDADVRFIEGQTQLCAETETQAVAAIRQAYARYARHNGHVRIATYSRTDIGRRINIDRDLYYKRDGKLVKGLLMVDRFTSERQGDGGSYSGDRLYLLASGEWLQIKRSGSWSNWEGAADYWGCGVSAVEDCDDYGTWPLGTMRTLTDAEVTEEYQLTAICAGLSAALETMAEKLPERSARLASRVQAARKLIEALA